MDGDFDFIVIGAGPAGAALASRLAHAKSAPKVLLIEAGGNGNVDNKRFLYERYTTFMLYPDETWPSYETEPITALNNRTIPYFRGKVIGGTSAVNFCAWTLGPRDDFERWAAEVDDEAFDWKHRVSVAKRMEAFDSNVASDYREYAQPDKSVHGTDGPISISWPVIWEEGIIGRLDSAKEAGWRLNPDINNGNPIGMGACPATAKAGWRVTSAAYLTDPPPNLTIASNHPATKILFEGRKAVGVLAGSRKFFASNEVLVSCGTIDTPKLLMLSGIGPEAVMEKHGIETVIDLPGVGQGLEDHILCTFVWREKSGSHSNWAELNSAPEGYSKARAQFAASGDGPLTSLFSGLVMGFAKADDLLETATFKALPQHVQDHMRKPSVPLYEITTHTPPFNPAADPKASHLTVVAYVQSPSSRGSTTLRSANPKDTPIIDVNYFSHPADVAIARAATRAALEYANTPSVKQDIIDAFSVPASDSDTDIDEFWRQNGTTVYHASCTVKMGKSDDEKACLDSSFRVKGIQNLRVADLSSTPFVLNCHTQSVAYFVGETAAAKLIEEYNL